MGYAAAAGVERRFGGGEGRLEEVDPGVRPSGGHIGGSGGRTDLGGGAGEARGGVWPGRRSGSGTGRIR